VDVPTRTVENRAEENSGEIDLLLKVLTVWDLGSIRVIGPRLELRVRHASSVYMGGGNSVRRGIGGGEEFPRRRKAFDGRRSYKL